MTASALRTTLAAAATAGLALAVAGPAHAATLAHPKTTTENGKTVMVLDDTQTGSKFTPKGGQPTAEFPDHEPAVGDAFAFTDDLRQAGVLVATDAGTCVFTGPKTTKCDVVVTFADGTVKATGVTNFDNDPSLFPLTGGTGAYQGIAGVASSHDLSDAEDPSDTKSTITVRFTLPSQASAGQASAGQASAGQVAEVPAGGAATGGGFSGDGVPVGLLGLAGAGLVTGAGIVGLGRRARRR